MNQLKRIPSYIWTLLSLFIGLLLGGLCSYELAGVAEATHTGLRGFINVVPLLIFIALSPAVSKLTSQGRGGLLAGSVIGWYLLTSLLAGLLGVTLSSIIFDIGFSAGEDSLIADAMAMFSTLNGSSGASLPLLAIVMAIIAGLLAGIIPPLQAQLDRFDYWMNNATPLLSRIMPFIVFFLGISLGVNTGATQSMTYYLWMSLYTLLLCVSWLAIYQVIAIKLIAKQSIRRVLKSYFFPTAVFAAGTCSSLATLPVNLQNVKKAGADENIANFVLPIGSVVNMDTSALAYVAYAPFIMTVVFDAPLTWSVLLVAWPAIVLFTIAAPGLPAGMGTALWSSTLFASLLGLPEAQATVFITTWIALSGGIPDMFRTATNCTCDGFTAILFSEKFKTKPAVVNANEVTT